MATSSIIKEFKVKDLDKFNKLMDTINNSYSNPKVSSPRNLEKGKKLLKEFKLTHESK